MSMKNSNDTIKNRTRDLPVCSTVPQPTAPLRALYEDYTADSNINDQPQQHSIGSLNEAANRHVPMPTS
jgi:hypothetical protein